MKNMLKRTLAVLVAVIMTVGSAPLSGFVGLELPDWLDFSKLFEVKAEATSYSGTCGENLTWSLDTDTGVLEISGTGAMTNWSSYSSAPWYSYRANITSVSLPDGLTSIGRYAFYGCTEIKELTIPASAKIYNSNHTFYNCKNIEKTILTKGTSTMQVYSTSTSDLTYTYYQYTPWYISGCPEIIIENGVTGIGDFAFNGCRSLTSITIPNSVTSIGNSAFRGCSSLTSITIPDSVASIGGSAFYACVSLESVIIPDGITSIDDATFYNCTSLISITIPDSVTNIGEFVFSYCESLVSITIPDSVTYIGASFQECTGLKELVMPASAKIRNSEGSFQNCINIEKVTLTKGTGIMQNYLQIPSEYPEANTFVGYTPWFKSGCPEIIIEDGVTNIGESAFQCCENILCITIPDSVTNIGARAFSGCIGLTDVYYTGSEEDWKSISIDTGNECLTNANVTIHFNYIYDPHIHSYSQSKTVDATCTKQGYTTYVCSECGDTYKDNYTDALGHSYSTKTMLPTCTAQGYTTYTCTRSGCGYSYKSNYTSATGHSYGNWVETAATCEKDGSRYKVCSKCSYKVTESIPKLEHDYESVVTPPSCGKQGYTTHTCVNCGNSYKDNYTTAPDHTYGDWITEKQSTCTSTGLKYKQCTCGDRFEETIPALGHSYKTTVTNPTHVDDGYTTYTCTRSGCDYNEKRDFVAAIGHTYGSWITDTAATCAKEGKRHKECSCGDKVEETIPKLAHSYKSSTVAPTCTAKGYTKFTCSGCGDTYKENYVSAKGHSYGSWVTETQATCAAEGKRYKVCSACSDKVEETIPKIAHSYADSVTAPTCTKGGYTTHTCSACGHSYTDTATDSLGHSYGDWKTEKQATCSAAGLKYKECSRCEDRTEEKIPVTDHSYVLSDTEPTCTEKGFTTHACKNCGYSYDDTFVQAPGHSYGEWVTDREASVLCEGLRHRICEVCEFKDEQSISKVTVDVESNTNYGLAVFTVVNAQTLKPIQNAQIFISTENDGENTFRTDENGKVSVVMPVGKQKVSVYADGCLTRNLTVNILSGTNNIPQIGLSDTKTYNAEIKHHVMTKEEIEDAGIDVSATENKHVVKYEVEISYEAEVDTFSLTYYMDDDDKIIGGGGTAKKDGETVSVTWVDDGNDKGHFYIPSNKPDEPDTTIYPAAENFYLIIRGEVKWLKEIFDVEMLVINNSNTDTLEDLTATLTLPEGLSLAKMAGNPQSLEQKVENVAGGKTQSVHWYVRGDKEGSYGLEARLQGKVMPFDEPIDDVFVAENNIQVYAGSALNLHFEFPSAAYYGEDYPITITLTNVSDRTLYNVNHMVQIEQGMEVFYSDGSSKEKIETSDWKAFGVEEFNPGDKIIIETSVNIFFESEIMQAKIESYIGMIDGLEQLVEAYKAVNVAANAIDGLKSCVSGCVKALDDFVASSTVSKAKAELFKQLHSKLSGLYSKYSKSGSKTFDAVAGLANSGISTTLNVITNDPQDWLEKHSEDDIKSLLKKITALESAMNAEESSQKFNIFDSLRTAISAIPIMFAFSDITMIESENNTTSIPWSYTVSKASPHYFGVSNVSKYMMSFVKILLGEVYSDAVPSYLQLISGVDDPFNTEEAKNYIIATEKEIAQFKAKDATGKVTFRAWIERSETGAKARTSSVSDDFVLTTDNDSAKYENGVLTFTGDGMISVQPQNTTGGTLYVEDSEGNVYTYVIEVVEAHTCKAGAQNMVIAPTREYDGFAVKCCDTCGEIMEVINLTKEDCCSTHSFGKWETESEATCSAEGINTRTCSNCGFVEYQFVAASGHAISSHKITKASTCTEKGVMTYYCSCGESYTEEIIETGHTFSTWNTTKEATCEETGLKTAVCTVCKQTVEEVIPETGHIDADSNGKCDVCTQDPEPEDEEQVTLKSISVYSEPTKKDYYLGESLDTSGLKLKLTYSDGTTEIVSDGFSTNGFSSVSSGTKTVTVYYNGLKTSFDIEINTVSINIAEESKSMFIGDTYKLSATTVPDGQEIIWKSSDENIVTVSNGVVMAVSDGNATVTASIVVGGKTYSASCTVVVSDPKGVVTSVTIVDEKLKTDYYVGDPLNTSGLQLEITYADGTKEIISSGFATNGFDSSDAGSKTVVVEYGDFTLNYDITVKPADERKALYSGTCGAQGDNLTWTLYENGQLVINGEGDMKDYSFKESAPWDQYNESISEVLICDGVTTIGYCAFCDCDNLISITIPNSVTNIGGYAFEYCDSLTSVTIPDSVTIIGDYAFYDCDNLASVFIGNGVTIIGNSAFEHCDSLTSVTIGNSVTTIGKGAFSDCYNLTCITIPDSVTTIENSAFSGCDSLTNIIIPSSVTSIGDDAFCYCDSLTNIIIPDSVTSIGDDAFYYCDNLASVFIGNGVTIIGDYAFYYCDNLASVFIGNGVTIIGNSAFEHCDSLTSVTMPDRVTVIGNSAFFGCGSLTSVTIPDSVTTIGDDAFSGCGDITSIKVDSNNKYYSNDNHGVLFNKDKTKLIQYPIANTRKSYMIPDGVTIIGNSAFKYCDTLTNIIIPDSVTSIGDDAFYYCDSLASVSIGNGVTTIGDDAFYSCVNIKDVYYIGTETKWNDIVVGKNNDCLIDNEIHFDFKVLLESVSIYANTCEVKYYVGDMLNTSGLTLTATYNNGTTKTISSGFTCTPTTLNTVGTQKIIVTYGGKTTSFNVIVEEVVVTSLTVKSNPTNISYYVGDTLNTNGLTLTATYDNGTTKTISSGFTCTPTTLSTAGTQKITVTYGGKTTSFNVTVEAIALERIAVKTNPDKTNYYVGDTLNTSGLTLTATYNDGTTKTVSSGFTCTPTTLNTAGAQKITVTYGGKTTSFNVTVKEVALASIAVKSNPTKTSYYVGDTLNTNGLTLTAIYNNGTTKTVNGGFTCTPEKLETAGTQKITVTYGDKSTSFNVEVKAVEVSSISIASVPETLSYYVGDTLLTKGLAILVSYNNGTSETVTSGFTYTPTTLETAGTQKITVTYGGKTTSFDVNVILRGNCGENLTWTLDIITGVLEISGRGEMESYNHLNSNKAPWYNNKSNIKCIKIADGVTSIGDSAFYNCTNLTNINISDSVMCIGEFAFYDCDNITSAVIPDNVATINKGAFLNCDNLASVTLGNGLKTIGQGAFERCYSLTNILIPDSVTIIDKWAFMYCENLKNITIGKGVAQIDTYAFIYCYNLDSITVDVNNQHFSSDSYGVLFNKDKSALIQYPEGNARKSYVIPSSVSSIGYDAFFSCNNLTNVTIPVSVTSIANQAFYSCYNLEKVYYTGSRNNWESVEKGSFYSDLISTALICYGDIISAPSVTTLNYGDTLILHADMNEALPSGWTIKWTANNRNFDYTVSSDSSTCTITPSKSGSTTFTATVYDENGNVISKDEQAMTSKAGFFDKIIAFFKKLFGLTKVIQQSIDVMY